MSRDLQCDRHASSCDRQHDTISVQVLLELSRKVAASTRKIRKLKVVCGQSIATWGRSAFTTRIVMTALRAEERAGASLVYLSVMASADFSIKARRRKINNKINNEMTWLVNPVNL